MLKSSFVSFINGQQTRKIFGILYQAYLKIKLQIIKTLFQTYLLSIKHSLSTIYFNLLINLKLFGQQKTSSRIGRRIMNIILGKSFKVNIETQNIKAIVNSL